MSAARNFPAVGPDGLFRLWPDRKVVRWARSALRNHAERMTREADWQALVQEFPEHMDLLGVPALQRQIRVLLTAELMAVWLVTCVSAESEECVSEKNKLLLTVRDDPDYPPELIVRLAASLWSDSSRHSHADAMRRGEADTRTLN